jgi:hypothetical protein
VVQLSRAACRYTAVNRLAAAGILALGLLFFPVGASAEGTPYRTVIDGLVPATPGLTIGDAFGGCDFTIVNTTGQDVVLFDQSKPTKPIRFTSSPAPKPGGQPPIPIKVHLVGAWPCVSLPAVTEDQRWNHSAVPVLFWSLQGQVGAVTFKLKAHSLYDPALDPISDLMFYLRLGVGVLALGAVVMLGPYLYRRRRQILYQAG